MIPVRYKDGDRVVRVFEGGVDVHHPLARTPCVACDQPIFEYQEIALVYIGPGNSGDAQRAYRDGRTHTGASVAIHKSCAGVTE